MDQHVAKGSHRPIRMGRQMEFAMRHLVFNSCAAAVMNMQRTGSPHSPQPVERGGTDAGKQLAPN